MVLWLGLGHLLTLLIRGLTVLAAANVLSKLFPGRGFWTRYEYAELLRTVCRAARRWREEGTTVVKPETVVKLDRRVV